MVTTAAAEIPYCQWMAADPSRYKPRPQAMLLASGSYDVVVIHCTDGHPNGLGDAQMWSKPPGPGEVATSAHFIIDSDKAIQCVPLRFAAQHAHDANSHSIGIEHAARSPRSWGPSDPGFSPTPELYALSARIAAWLLKAAGLPATRDYVKGHHEIDPKTTHGDCPDGCGWDWSQYMLLVSSEYALLPMPTPAPAA